MSRELISRSPDLKLLQDEGYQIEIVSGHLLVRQVPYVTAQREVKRGTLVSPLTLAGEKTARPDSHVVFFAGEHPCHKDGREIQQVKHQQEKKLLAAGLEVDRSFSNKPANGYRDYYEKMTTYANILSSPATSIDPTASARFAASEATTCETVFVYSDTATARAEIGSVSARLAGLRIGIVGLGGTGSYILDLVAKTPVAEVHLFDGDRFLQHNAFRAPGAPSLERLQEAPLKVEYFHAIYSRMHKGINVHPYYLDGNNAQDLAGMDFVFLCLDSGASRRALIETLHQHNKPFIDVGMGIEILNDLRTLIGTLRVTMSTPDHRTGERRIPTSQGERDDDYGKNIQIADLNSLNAALAVLRWKKFYGFYQDLEREHLTTYTVNVNQVLSEEHH